MAIHAVARFAVIGPTVPAGAGGLIGLRVQPRPGRCRARKINARDWAGALQKSDRFVDRGDALAGCEALSGRAGQKAAAKMSTHFLEITGIDVRVLPRQVHFAHHRGAVIGTTVATYSLRPAMMRAERSAAKMTRARNGRTPFGSNRNAVRCTGRRDLTPAIGAANFPALPRDF